MTFSDTRGPDAPVRLLIAYDGSDTAADAVRAVAQLFPRADARVTFVPKPSAAAEQVALARIGAPDAVIVAAAQEHARAIRARTEGLLERGRSIAERVGLRATGEIAEAATPWRALVRAAADIDPDIIVCGSRGRGAFARSLLGSTSSSLLYHADRSVLVVPPGGGDLDGPTVIGYDGSDGARAAIDAAARLLPGRPAVVVHAWSSLLERSYAGESAPLIPVADLHEATHDLEELLAVHGAELAEEGAALAREAGLTARAVATEACVGTWRALTASARGEGASVIVVGHRGRGALASTVLGSVSAGLAHNAELPVLIIR